MPNLGVSHDHIVIKHVTFRRHHKLPYVFLINPSLYLFCDCGHLSIKLLAQNEPRLSLKAGVVASLPPCLQVTLRLCDVERMAISCINMKTETVAVIYSRMEHFVLSFSCQKYTGKRQVIYSFKSRCTSFYGGCLRGW